MAEHTPTPWRVDHRANTRVVAGKDETIAATGCQSSIRDDWEANASFIVRAANNHETLVKALQDALCELSACAVQMNCHSGGSVVRAIGAARRVLADVSTQKEPL